MHKNKVPFPPLHRWILVSHYLRHLLAHIASLLSQTRRNTYEDLDCLLLWMGTALSSEAAISEPRT